MVHFSGKARKMNHCLLPRASEASNKIRVQKFEIMMKYLLGYDLGSSSVKVSLLEAATGKTVASVQSPSTEMPMHAAQEGWAEQHPDMWWAELVNATHLLRGRFSFQPTDVAAIGISYQMHGLVLIDKHQNVLRPSIIWCDSRAVGIGNQAFTALGEPFCLENYLNSPANFTASKARWVIENEPKIWEKVDKIMLPGDFIAMRMTGEVCTTASGLSEGIMWNFKRRGVAKSLLDNYGMGRDVIPKIVETFGNQGIMSKKTATELGLAAGIPITYRAGDQPNNAFSLNVLNVGEVAATAGTSGVVYGITDKADFDPKSRVNTFVHVNDSDEKPRNGVLLCVNGTGISNAWMRRVTGGLSYDEMTAQAAKIPVGTEGVKILPFGNGAERIFNNKQIGGSVIGLDFNRHSAGHLFRGTQEGIVFALNYGLTIMQTVGVKVETVKAGKANMFLSPLFREAFANTTGATIELFDTDGATGAARGAGIGCGFYKSEKEAFIGLEKIDTIEPNEVLKAAYTEGYQNWLNVLNHQLD
ncbi:MAG: FGGY family carbohydrate kinase [Saprospiraceae bacterium]|nr:FGGY family carbohydrate kinase [Saprospiraceae bacterium]